MSRIDPFFPPLAFDEAKLAEAHKVLADHKQALSKQAKTALITCTSDSNGKGCGHRQPVGVTTFIQTHWYTPPHGCTDGDYWNTGEGQFECKSCGKITRLYDCPEITALKPHFFDVKEVYDR